MPATDPARDVWNDTLLQNPHEVSDKRTRVQKMFAAIAPSYDLNNRLHSLWMDQRWRRKAVMLAALQPDDCVLDVACGTGDLSLEFVKELFAACLERASRALKSKAKPIPRSLPRPQQVIGIDFTYEMLPLARRKPSLVHPAVRKPSP